MKKTIILDSLEQNDVNGKDMSDLSTILYHLLSNVPVRMNGFLQDQCNCILWLLCSWYSWSDSCYVWCVAWQPYDEVSKINYCHFQMLTYMYILSLGEIWINLERWPYPAQTLYCSDQAITNTTGRKSVL